MAKIIATVAPRRGSAAPTKLKAWLGRWLAEVAEKGQSFGYLDSVGGLQSTRREPDTGLLRPEDLASPSRWGGEVGANLATAARLGQSCPPHRPRQDLPCSTTTTPTAAPRVPSAALISTSLTSSSASS